MHREPLNQGEVNAFSLAIIPVVMAIVFFLSVHPYNSASSTPVCVGQMITCLLLP